MLAEQQPQATIGSIISQLSIKQDQIKGTFIQTIAQLEEQLIAAQKENELIKSKIPNWKELIS